MYESSVQSYVNGLLHAKFVHVQICVYYYNIALIFIKSFISCTVNLVILNQFGYF